jgi:hypothetical protein
VGVLFFDRATSRRRSGTRAERTTMDRHVGEAFRSQKLFHIPEVQVDNESAVCARAEATPAAIASNCTESTEWTE